MNTGQRPNLLFIMADDMGAWAMGCAENKEIHTPNLDRLAAGGTRMENFFCVSPVCSPARLSIYTGKIPSQHGVHDWLSRGHMDAEVLSDELKAAFQLADPPYEYRWPRMQLKDDRAIRYLDHQRTLTGTLAQAGYECGLSGKWHMGDSATPQAGFTYWKTTGIGGENYYYPVVYEDGRMVMKHNRYVTDYITDQAMGFLDGRDVSRPFCLAVHYTAPHSPWSEECHPRQYIDLYRDCPFDSIPDLPPHPWVQGVDQTLAQWKQKPHDGVRFIHAKYPPIRETWRACRRECLIGYFAAVTAMDAGIGRILERLEREGLMENTLIVFTGDNGSNMGHHGIIGKGNGTYPLNMYDTSVKVPGIFAWRGTLPENAVCQTMASHYDLMPTLLDLCGLESEINGDLPGRSFLRVLTGEQANFRRDVVVLDEYGPVRMIRTPEWKLVRRYPDGPDELYDLLHDPGEAQNRIGDLSLAPVVSDLSARLESWFRRYADPSLDGRREPVTGKGQINSHKFEK